MKTTISIRIFVLLFFIVICQCALVGAEAPIKVDAQNLLVSVDPAACH